MPSFSGEFVSVVVVGRQNPQILAHDFLVGNGILPIKEEPFKGLAEREGGSPFTEFISLPVISKIGYGPVSITVEENRYQALDQRFDNPASSPIINITKRYFEILRYTPLTLGGLNFHGKIVFSASAEEEQFDCKCGMSPEQMRRVVGSHDYRAGITIGAPWHKGTIELQVVKAKEAPGTSTVNFNYEFKFKQITSFIANLDEAGLVLEKFKEVLSVMGAA